MRNYFSIFLSQYAGQLERKNASSPYLLTLLGGDFWWLLLVLLHIVVFIFFLFLVIKKIDFKIKFILVGFLVSVMFVMAGKEMWYLMYFQPFAGLLIAACGQAVYAQKKHLAIVSFWFIVFLVVVADFILTFNVVAGKANKDYFSFTTEVKKNTPQGSKIFLSVAPDPYFELRDSYSLYEFSPLKAEKKEYVKILNNSDYVLYNFIGDINMYNYVEANKESQTVIGETSIYKALLIKLVPRSKRKSL